MELILVRGLPGSGKTTYGQKLVDEGRVAHAYEADQYFTDKEGNYNFDRSKLAQAHGQCRIKTEAALKKGESVAVTNTFVKRWEMADYIDMGKRLGAELVIMKMDTQFDSIHDLPEGTLERMQDSWQDVPGEIIIGGQND